MSRARRPSRRQSRLEQPPAAQSNPTSLHRPRLDVLKLLWLAALLLCASVGGATACTQGSLKLDLLPPSGSGCGSNLHALCLASFQIGLDSSCAVTITPLAAAGAYVPGIWSTNPAATYAKLTACPTAARAATPTSAPQQPADVRAAIELALEQHVYGSQNALALSSAWVNGTVRLTAAADGCELRYAITEVTQPSAYLSEIGSDAFQAVCEDAGTLANGTDCQSNTVDACPLGTQGVDIATGKVCAACPAGSFSADGVGSCTACAAGKFAGSVAATACTNCTAGSFSAAAGASACQPCGAGTYQAAPGQKACDPCPSRSYARLPGATQCVRCVAGVATCVAGDGCNTNFTDAPSPGFNVLSLTTPDTLSAASCALPGSLSFGSPALFGQCTLSQATPTRLVVYVDSYCGVEIFPIGDTACAEPAAAYWTSVKHRAHYVAPGRIASSLSASSPTSSFLLALTPVSGTALTLSYWPATTDPAHAADVAASTKVCSGTVDVIGGQVDGLPSSGPVACPAGTYDDPAVVDGCRPCPVGSVCGAASTAATSCAADQYQPYLGQPSGCLTCNAAAVPRYTSNAGDDYCTVPWVDTTCGDGEEFDADNLVCIGCEPGTYRMAGRDEVCLPCEPGFYSAANATNCTLCPVGQFSPIYGLAARSTGDKKCLYCSAGSVAKTDGGLVGQLGSTFCDPCEPGTISAVVGNSSYATCAPCDDGWYRPGDASPLNNVCKQIPAGWKEKSRLSTAFDRSELEICIKGEVSFWRNGTRTPASPQTCQPCLGDNTFAPRTGLASCSACRAGFVPAKSNSSLPGNDKCVSCSGNTYRPASSTSATCLTCTAGREVESSSYTSCDACDAGFFMPDNLGGNDTTKPANDSACAPCPVNQYQPQAGQTFCLLCPAGSSTPDEGNVQCTPCATGYYSPSGAVQCLPAPPGTYVNISGAATWTACPPGTFSAESGSDTCDSCPPGQYANTVGSKSCKTCPAGTFSAGRASTCVACSPGYYAAAGSGACSPCKAGWYANMSRASTCWRCPLGNQCPTIATKQPQPCPRGQFASKEGSRLCSPCPINTHQSLPGQRGCALCPRGFTTRGMQGQSSCSPIRTFTLRRLLQ